MTRATFRSFAKVNLHLQVAGRRADGYHELRTVFQTIELHDRLEIELGGAGVELAIDGAPDLGAGPENLVCRAAAAFQARFGGAPGVRLRLAKKVPRGGGLGGGSSNAAATLLGLRALTGVPERRLDLWPLARALGADVPFFLVGGTAFGVGRGDEIVALPDLPPSDLWLILPPYGVATAAVFAELARGFAPAPLAPPVRAWLAGEAPASLVAFAGVNDLEGPAARVAPALAALCDTLRRTPGVQWLRMTGSGATLIAGLEAGAEAGVEAAVTRAVPAGARLVRTRTLARASAEAAFRCGGGDAGDGDH